MIKTKKQIDAENSAISSIYQRAADAKSLAKEKTICVFILEGETLVQWEDLDIFPTKSGIMMNKTELSILINNHKKSTKKSANAVIVYGKGNAHGVWTEKEKYHWYIKL